jgi:transposase
MLTVEKSAIKTSLDAPKQLSALEIEILQKNLTAKFIAAKAKMASFATEEPKAILEVVRETMGEIFAQLPEQPIEIERTIAAVVEGIIQGITLPKRSAIAELQKQIQVLQAKKEEEEQTLQSQVHLIFNAVKESGKTNPASIRDAIASAIEESTRELLHKKNDLCS